MTTTKERRLHLLRRRIVNDLYTKHWREVWFFPSMEGVKGWQGEQDIMFVALNPSTGHFPDKSVRLFYTELRRNCFEQAHLTDAVKERATATEALGLFGDRLRMRQHRRYLMEEVSIIAPRLIVPVGQKAARILKEWLTSDRRVTAPIPHYAQQVATDATRRRFRASMAAVRKLYAESD